MPAADAAAALIGCSVVTRLKRHLCKAGWWFGTGGLLGTGIAYQRLSCRPASCMATGTVPAPDLCVCVCGFGSLCVCFLGMASLQIQNGLAAGQYTWCFVTWCHSVDVFVGATNLWGCIYSLLPGSVHAGCRASGACIASLQVVCSVGLPAGRWYAALALACLVVRSVVWLVQ